MTSRHMSYLKTLLLIIALLFMLLPATSPTQAQCLSCIEWEYCLENPDSEYCSEPDYTTHVCEEEESEELVCIDEDGDGEDDNGSSESRDDDPYIKLLTR